MRTLLLRMIYRTRRRMIGYLLAALVAVALVLSFGMLAQHPAVSQADVPPIVNQLLFMGYGGVALFAIFFITFFHRFVIRSRGQEFGVLLTLGMLPRQLAQLIWMESLVVATVALLLGSLLGLGGSILLLPVVGPMLGLPAMRALIHPSLLLVAGGFFGVLFVVDAALSARHVRTTMATHLLLTPRRRQEPPVLSQLRLLGGLGCLGVAYTLALGASANEVVGTISMLPTVVLCAVGTKILFDQALGRLLARLRGRTHSGLVLLHVSRLMHRLRESATILTVIALLNTGVLTLISIVAGALAYSAERATSRAEYDQMIQLVGVALFISAVLSVLCFLAAGSTLYVKLLTQVPDDRRQAARLRRLGLSRRQLGWLLLGECAVLFGAPVAVAVIHSLVAIGEVTLHLIPANAPRAVWGTWRAYAIVVSSYSGIFVVACGVTWARYMRQVLPRDAGRQSSR